MTRNPVINKELKKYLNNDIFINPLNIPLFENCDEKLNLIKIRLETLLILPHQQFWCHVLYDKSVLRSLQSFLSYAKRPHELFLTSTQMPSTEKDVYNIYYRLILRLTTHKEINMTEFSALNFASLIYDNYIIDIPIIMDICSIFGEDNSLIAKSICGIFSCQKLYQNDLRDYINQSIRIITEKLQNISPNGSIKTEKESIKSKVDQHLLKKSVSVDESIDFLYYLIDFSRNWSIFLNSIEISKEIGEILIKIQFHKLIELIFEKIVPFSQSKINKFETKEPEMIKRLLSVLCYYLIEVWRSIFVAVFIKRFDEEQRESEDNYSLIGECVAMISSCQDNSLFADAMYLKYPLNDDINVIQRAIKADKNEYYSEYVDEALKEVLNNILSRQTLFSQCNTISLPSSRLQSTNNQRNRGITDNLSQIRDIFTDLSEHDIQCYMKTYDCSPECMLESLLECAIDVSFVKNLSAHSATSEKLAQEEEDLRTEAILLNHRNIYDGDEFDSGTIKASQIHLGKRRDNLDAVIDQGLKSLIMDIVCRQGEEEEDEQRDRKLLENENNVYNDEFDDVYGICHDGVVNERNTEEILLTDNKEMQSFNSSKNSVSVPKRAHRIVSANNNTVPLQPATEEVRGTVMEPSIVRYSHYNKNQSKKNRFQDHQPQQQQSNTGSAGTSSSRGGQQSHRQGSHGVVVDKVKKDHRPKGARNNYND